MSTGKQVALILGIVGGGVVLAIACCAGFIYWGYQSSAEIASPRIDDFFAAVNQGKSAELYANDTSADFRSVTTKQDFTEFCELLKTRLGPLESKSFQSFNRRQHNADSMIEVAYEATFERASGTISAMLIEEGGKWKFSGIHVNSPALLQDSVPGKTEDKSIDDEGPAKTPQ